MQPNPKYTFVKPDKRPRGRPPGSKNKKTLEKEAKEREEALANGEDIAKSKKICKPIYICGIPETLNVSGMDCTSVDITSERDMYGYDRDISYTLYSEETAEEIPKYKCVAGFDIKNPAFGFVEDSEIGYTLIFTDCENKKRQVYTGNYSEAEISIELFCRIIADGYAKFKDSPVSAVGKTDGIRLKGHEGTFRVIKTAQDYTLLQSERYGENAYGVILKKRAIFKDDVCGLYDNRVKTIFD